jgi:hypothetical protein
MKMPKGLKVVKQAQRSGGRVAIGRPLAEIHHKAHTVELEPETKSQRKMEHMVKLPRGS